MVPDRWLTPAAAAGVVFSVFGVVFSFNAILWLGRSLGIVVSVREIVLGGPYRYVRHPDLSRLRVHHGGHVPDFLHAPHDVHGHRGDGPAGLAGAAGGKRAQRPQRRLPRMDEAHRLPVAENRTPPPPRCARTNPSTPTRRVSGLRVAFPSGPPILSACGRDVFSSPWTRRCAPTGNRFPSIGGSTRMTSRGPSPTRAPSRRLDC